MRGATLHKAHFYGPGRWHMVGHGEMGPFFHYPDHGGRMLVNKMSEIYEQLK